MSTAELSPPRAIPQSLPDNFVSIQPGGGRCYRIELAWGRWRRWWLKRFRPSYVRRMAGLRKGDAAGAAHEILDPRDLKYCRNRCSCYWEPADDPFRWRGRLPFARWGLAELQLMGWPLLAPTIVLACTRFWYLAVLPAVPLCLIVYFFRDPSRRIPAGPGLLVAPADGKVVEITRLGHDDFIGGPAVRIGIFLSIFNVHLNRVPAPVAGDRVAVFARRVSQRAKPEARCGTRTRGSAWRRNRPRTGGWQCVRFPGRSPGGSSATFGPAKCSIAGRSSA